eukprot:4833266-Amphidinium_carterae.1
MECTKKLIAKGCGRCCKGCVCDAKLAPDIQATPARCEALRGALRWDILTTPFTHPSVAFLCKGNLGSSMRSVLFFLSCAFLCH